MGCKLANIDWDEVDRYLNAGCSGLSIASKIGVHSNTLYQRCKIDKDVEFVKYRQQKISEGDDILRCAQFDNAKDGNTSMQIWLGKQRLGQKDKQETTQTNINISIDSDDAKL